MTFFFPRFISFIFLFVGINHFISAQDPLSKNVTLLDHWNSTDITMHPSTKVRYNDVWGYTQDGKEYAMIGSTEGVHFFSIEGNKLKEIDFIKGKFTQHTVVHRDIKTYKHYAYLVCDEGNSSLQIVDLQYLPDSVHLVYENDVDFVKVHNLFLDEVSELMYANLITTVNPTTQIQGRVPMRIYSLEDPTNPVLRYSGPNAVDHVHDVYARGNLAILNCGYDGMRVYDVSNPSSPILKQNITAYTDMGYNHQGWLTPDGTRYIFGDESKGKRLKIYERNDFQINYKAAFGTNHSKQSVPHNVMCDDTFLYVAYYNEGLRIYDIRNNPREIAHYNTFNEEDTWYKMNGAWGIYSQLSNGKLLLSDRQSGLFLFQFNKDVALYNHSTECALFPNPVENQNINITIPSDAKKLIEYKVYSTNGTLVDQKTIENWNTYQQIPMTYAAGTYLVEIFFEDYRNALVNCIQRVVIP